MALVDAVVVLGTQQTEPVDVGVAAFGPPVDVMDLAPLGCCTTPNAALVSGNHGDALSGCGQSG